MPRSFGWQVPLQQSASVVHPAPVTWQVPGPCTQIGGFWRSSHTSQQPLLVPELQVSPVGLQSGLERSIWHSPSVQMFEQHSAATVHGSLSILHCAPPQTPPLQFSSQQSKALVQAVPAPTQKGRHLTSPVPVSGSQRPLQQSPEVAHSVPAASQSPASMHTPSMQKWEQQASGSPQACPVATHWLAPP